MRSRTGFAQTVALLDRHFQPIVNRLNELLSEWSGTRIEHAKAAEIVFVNCRMFPKQQNDWWHDVGKAYSLMLYDRAEFLNIELWHDYRR